MIKIFFFTIIITILTLAAHAQYDTLSVIQLTDTHICNLNGYHPEFVKSRQHYGQGMYPLENFIAIKPQQLKAKALIITGDLIDFYEAETASETMLDTQIEQFASIYYSSKIPIYLTLGNHDISSYWVKDSSEIESYQLQAQSARAAWIRNLSCFRQGTYFMQSLPIGETTYRLIFLDNGYRLGNGMILDIAQLNWLEGMLIQFPKDPVLIFMHKYLAVPDLNRDSLAFTNKPIPPWDTETCSKGIFRLLNENENIKVLFCGHGHKNISEWISLPSGHKIMQTETAAFARDSGNWRLLKFTVDCLVVCSTGSTEKEYRIELKEP